MTRKLACLADCDCAFHGDDPDELGRRMRRHLEEDHGVPADPAELATLSIPVAGVRPADPSSVDGRSWAESADAPPDA